MNINKKNTKILSFREVVDATPDVSGRWCPGIKALAEYSNKVTIPKQVQVDGSLDIDASTSRLYPNDNRWDYAICCDGFIYYIEFHSAITSEVSRVIRKYKWLRNWLATKAPEFVRKTDFGRHPFYWIQSSDCQIPHHMPQYKMAVSHKLKPLSKWDYSDAIKGKY